MIYFAWSGYSNAWVTLTVNQCASVFLKVIYVEKKNAKNIRRNFFFNYAVRFLGSSLHAASIVQQT